MAGGEGQACHDDSGLLHKSANRAADRSISRLLELCSQQERREVDPNSDEEAAADSNEEVY
jgi:hypothetical protein